MSSPQAEKTGQRPIRFLLDGRVHEATDVEPTTTVLNYLREELQRVGTKEGCAEGDCGACAVVIAEPDADRVRFRAINSCIRFLPTLDGKALYTVESLKRLNNGRLHPAQQAMVDCHGSQCGFCTPGFVMSLFALYRNNPSPDRAAIDDALSGNLCRCTGYRPIIAAAQAMRDYEPDQLDEQALRRELDQIQPDAGLALATDKGYFSPVALSELTALLARHPDAVLLAGGTDVGLWVTKQHRALPRVIHIGNVAELQRIDETPERLEIGAAVSLTDAFAVMEKHYPDLHEISRRFASPPIRNAGTLCGNIANGSPIGDAMPALMALGATLVLRNEEGTRELPLDEFYLGYQQTALAPSEFVQAARIPLQGADEGCHLRSYKVSKRFDQDISAVCGAYFMRLEHGVAADIRICYGGMAAVPKRAEHCEGALRGRPWNEAAATAGIKALSRDYAPLTDLRATAAYRLRVAGNLLKRFYLETTGAGDFTVWQ